MSNALARMPSRAWIAVVAIVLAFGFLGTRGIWDPDEGRYSNVALNMLDSGNWVDLQRNDTIGHWTKPPLTYWTIAASAGTFGRNAWAARLPSALAYLVCVWCVWRIARRLAPGAQDRAALMFATMLLPFGASHFLSTDFLLAACEALAMLGFVEARFGEPAHARRWLWWMWIGFALAFLTKGPPGLLPLLAVIAFDLAMPGTQRPRMVSIIGLLSFVAIAAPWYLVVTQRHPGLLQYFLGEEVVNRVASDNFSRHGQWYAWFTVYAPTFLIGSLPWTPVLLRTLRGLPALLKSGWRNAEARRTDAATWLSWLWLLLPLLVFCLSRSRLPLYVLPLFVPLSVLMAQQCQREARAMPRWRWIVVWVLMLLAAGFAAAQYQTHKNAAPWADAIRAQSGGAAPERIVFVDDMARYGLNLHLHAQVYKVSLNDEPQARFNPDNDAHLTADILSHYRNDVWITKQAQFVQIAGRIAALGYRARTFGTHRDRVMFRVMPISDSSAPALSAASNPIDADVQPLNAVGSESR